jgi:hypothetical protein
VDDSDYLDPLVDIYSSRPPLGKRYSNNVLIGISYPFSLKESQFEGGGKPDHLTYFVKQFKFRHLRQPMTSCNFTELEKAVFLPDISLVLDGGACISPANLIRLMSRILHPF